MTGQCVFVLPTGQGCRAPRLHDSEFCLMHSPEHAKEVQEARRLGGLRRKREAVTAGAYEFIGLDTIAGIRRLLEVAVLDTLAMENSIARNRTLAYLAMAAIRTHEVGELEERTAVLEQALRGRRINGDPLVFEIEPGVVEGSWGGNHESDQAT